MTAAGDRPPRWWWGGVLGLVVLGAVLHLSAGYVFPRPWPDESHFLAPALALAAGEGLAAPALNAPEGIFWMPSGYYAAVAPLLVTGLDPLAAGRALSLAGIAVFAIALADVVRRAGVPPAVALLAAGAWLCLPRVVAAGNIARMEALVLAVTGIALWLVARDRWIGAVGALALAPLVHPVGLVPLMVGGAAFVVRGRRIGALRWEWGLVVAAVLAWTAEAVHFWAHAETAREHLGFQLRRKAERPPGVGVWAAVTTPVALAAGAAATRWRAAAGPLQALWVGTGVAAGFVVAEVAGREVWYGVLGRETAVLLVGAAGLAAAMARWPAGRRGRGSVAWAGLLSVAVVAGLVWTLGPGWFRMHPRPSSRAEWRGFVDSAVVQLERLDAAGGATATVHVDPISGFGQELFGRSWRRLVFVQPTPATPLPADGADYLLLTPGAPFVTRGLAATWGAQDPVVDVVSTRRAFRLQVYANPER